MLEAAPIAETAWDAQKKQGDVRLQYKSQQHFEQLAVAFGMMAEWRDRVPRAAYHGVVSSLDHAPHMTICMQTAVAAFTQAGGVM